MAQDKHTYGETFALTYSCCTKCGVARAAVLGGVEVIHGKRVRFKGWASVQCGPLDDAEVPHGPG